MNMRCARGLYAITDCAALPPAVLVEKSAVILSLGIALFQYRNKTTDYQQKKSLALVLQSLCRKYHTPFIVNDDLRLAKELAADGIHLGKTDIDINTARGVLDNKIIGISCYNDVDLAIRAEKASADYVAFGACFPSVTKPHAPSAELATLQQAKSILTIPIVAIGGIKPDNAQPLLAAKVDFIAVSHGLFNSNALAATVKKYKRLFNE